MKLGIVLIVLGILFLLKNLGLLSTELWEVFWPIVLIIVGLSLIIKQRN